MNNNLKSLLQAYLMTSYLYYSMNVSVILDDLYDLIAKTLLAHYDQFEHQHKHLVSKADLEAGTLYHLRGGDYPLMVQMAAEKWLNAGPEERQRKEDELRNLLSTFSPSS